MNKNKAIIGTDFHVRPSELDKAKRLLDFVLEQLKEKQPEYYINLGDTFHTKNLTYISAKKLYKEFLIEVANMGIKIIHLVGNHDYANPYYTAHSLDEFEHLHENITIVDDYLVLGDNVFINYCREKERFAGFLEKAGNVKRIFAHMDMNGMTPGSGWEEISPFFDPEYFENYEQVISGHIHLAQEKKLKSGTEIVIVGSGYTTDFGETDQKKRLLWFDLETGDWDEILTGLTLHKTIRIKATDPLPEIPEDEYNDGVEFRVIPRGTKEEIALIDKPKNYKAKIEPEFIFNESSRLDLSSTETKDETMKKYVEAELEKNYSEEVGFDVDELLRVGKKFLPKG